MGDLQSAVLLFLSVAGLFVQVRQDLCPWKQKALLNPTHRGKYLCVSLYLCIRTIRRSIPSGIMKIMCIYLCVFNIYIYIHIYIYIPAQRERAKEERTKQPRDLNLEP